MKIQLKYHILFLTLFFSNLSISQEVLDATYYFVNGRKLFSIEQRNNTLYEYRCDSNFECRKKARKHYKISKSKNEGNFTLLVLEKTDSIPLSIKPIRNDRYSIMRIEKLNKNRINVIHEIKRYTKDSILKIPFQLYLTENKFGFTYYEENYLKSLEGDYKINKDFANEIIESIKVSNIKLIKFYQNTKTGDLYGSGLFAELISREMIKRNLSPILAINKIENAMREY